MGRSQMPRGLRCRSTAARLLRLWVLIPTGAWVSVCCECCVLSGRGLCDGLITSPEESYRLWCVVCDLETSRMRRPWPALGRSATGGDPSYGRSQWPCGLRRGSVAASLLWLRVRIPPGAWMFVVSLCVGLIIRPEESCRVWYVWVWSWILDNEALSQ